MEKNKTNLEIDVFMKKNIKEIPKEKPSVDFTLSVMKSIYEEKSKATIFNPQTLISKKGWILIFAILTAILFIPFKESKTSFSIPKIDFSFLNKLQISNFFDSFSISNTSQYAIFFCGLMMIAQIVFLKRYFEKRLN